MKASMLVGVLLLLSQLPVAAQYRDEALMYQDGMTAGTSKRADNEARVPSAGEEAAHTQGSAWEPGDLPTIGTQILGGAVGAAAIGLPVIYLPRLVFADGESTGAAVAYILLSSAAVSFGLAEGIMLAGDLFDGNGDFGYTFAGTVTGILLGAAAFVEFKGTNGQLVAPVLALALPIYAYHASATPISVITPQDEASAAMRLPLERPGRMHISVPIFNIPLGNSSTR